jgi:cAMP-dependent protein kinase regulator
VLAKGDNDEELSVTDDSDSGDTDATVTPSVEQPPIRKKRRESIFAEKINDEADFELKVIDKSQQNSERILQILENNLFFSHLDQDQMNQVVNAMFLVEKKEGDIIINQGDDGDNFYIIDTGSVEVFIKTVGSEEEAKLVKTCKAGDSFGELAIMYNSPRAASCIAKGDVRLWALDRVAFKVILMKTTRAQRETYRGFLSSAQVFSELNEYEILSIADALVEESFEDGVVICKQDEIGDKFYLIKDGKAICTQVGADGEERKVLELSSGAYFGEIGE